MADLSKRFLVLALGTFICVGTQPARADAVFRVVYSSDVQGGSDRLSSVTSVLTRFFSQHPTTDCNGIEVSVASFGSAPNINPDGVDIRSLTTLSTLRSQAENMGANVLVVRSLSYCGRQDAGYAGCASKGSSLVVEDNDGWSAKLHAALWLHEFGHSQGLASAVRTDGKAHSDSELDLMYPSVNGNNNALSPEECRFMSEENDRYAPADVGARIVLAQEVSEAPTDDSVSGSGETDVDAAVLPLEERFRIVTTPWIGGTPFELLDAIEDKEGLLTFSRSLIVDVRFVTYWANAAKVIGVYGAKPDINLLAFLLSQPIESVAGEDSRAFSDAKIAAIESLGYLAGRFADRDALRRLEEIKAQLTLDALAREGNSTLGTESNLAEQLSGAVVLDPSKSFSVGDALAATISAIASASTVIDPDASTAEAAARVRIEFTDDAFVSIPASDNSILSATRVIGPFGVPNSGGFIDLPKSVDPNLVSELPNLIDQVKNAQSFDEFMRQGEILK